MVTVRRRPWKWRLHVTEKEPTPRPSAQARHVARVRTWLVVGAAAVAVVAAGVGYAAGTSNDDVKPEPSINVPVYSDEAHLNDSPNAPAVVQPQAVTAVDETCTRQPTGLSAEWQGTQYLVTCYTLWSDGTRTPSGLYTEWGP